ncbi:adenine phosphoribosyltransferase [Geomicrobium sp. JCM 19037]|uniref:adenine phosphoribosyltransferase n=1 Tax=Geomicrobium sp. JCM 19037 TaxID=1460634 RepID=UPI000B20F4DB|nr:adenine phosphoribosyltransferase [Geomicrobium sp. JCM 19037]
MDYKEHITIIEDYPTEGIQFKDITPLLQNGPAYRSAILEMSEYVKERKADIIVGPEARGFVVGCPIAFQLEKSFVPVRKAGKLPRKVVQADYGLEYGNDTLAIHEDSIKPGDRVIITDDLLATGVLLKRRLSSLKSSVAKWLAVHFSLNSLTLTVVQRLKIMMCFH